MGLSRAQLHRHRLLLNLAKTQRKWRSVAAMAMVLAASGCASSVPKHLAPLPVGVKDRLQALNLVAKDPIYMRIFKQENALEVWKFHRPTRRYKMLKTYEICKYSGDLGPKFREGDRQAPEGFYRVRPAQMNPRSRYYLSFNIGYPNAFDRALGRTGSHIMVHGDCSSRGCYAMNDEQVSEIYALAREAFRGGQKGFDVHVFPFRMTPQNMAKHRQSAHVAFWQNLKEGYDHFAVTGMPPGVSVCAQRYLFNASTSDPKARFVATRACPDYTVPREIQRAVAAKAQKDQLMVRQIIAQETKEAAAPPLFAPDDASDLSVTGP